MSFGTANLNTVKDRNNQTFSGVVQTPTTNTFKSEHWKEVENKLLDFLEELNQLLDTNQSLKKKNQLYYYPSVTNK